jgi:hypothetical protein
MGFTDTKQLQLNLVWSGLVIDAFLVDTGTVTKLNDKDTSLEKIFLSGAYVITGTSLLRTANTTGGMHANPGIFFQELASPEPIIPRVSETGRADQLCQSLS